MSFGITLAPAPSAKTSEDFKARVENHRDHGGNAPTQRVLDGLAATLGALADQYPGRDIEVEECNGHFGDPGTTTDEGYVTFKVKVKRKT